MLEVKKKEQCSPNSVQPRRLGLGVQSERMYPLPTTVVDTVYVKYRFKER